MDNIITSPWNGLLPITTATMYSENGPKVFLGEHASHDNTWFNALAEASFMWGNENAAHAVKLACHAPLFVIRIM
ncbi:MAG: alpha-L-arabinofuranosidase C-terminal domain-containing protein [Blautia marasmi]